MFAKKTNKALTLAMAALAGGVLSGTALAANPDTTQMTVRATVPGACRIQNATTLDFGSVDNSNGLDTDGTATVEWRCTRNTSATITIDDGASGSREMTSPSTSTPLPYGLFQDPGRTLPWNTTDGISVTGAGMGAGNAQPVTVFGRVPASGAEAADPASDYTDTVTISIAW